jgi:ADP-ribose pyrophosphatase YjhB (NUDIX family)
LLSSSLYQKIVDSLPIASVEAVIVKGDSFLLLKRSNVPVKGFWWFAGGRIRKNETFQEALHREIEEETGLELTESKLLNVYERIFPYIQQVINDLKKQNIHLSSKEDSS